LKQETLVADSLVEAFVIEGGRPLNGKIRAAGNKNAALPIVADRRSRGRRRAPRGG
jgi:hypothetical protein